MALFWNEFYDKYWNFNSSKFVWLLDQAKKMQVREKAWRKFRTKRNIVLFSSVTQKDVWSYINKMSIFINSWIDIKTALSIWMKQTTNPKLKDIIIETRLNIDHWITMAETMRQYPDVFDPLVTALIWVWEKTWQLWRILSELDKSLLESIELKAKVKWAMIYPAILMTLTVWVVTFMMISIVPKITETFAKADVVLPPLTRFIVAVSNFFINDWLKWIIIFVLMIIFVRLLKKTNFWRTLFWNMAIKFPVFWKIVKQSNIIYFINSFTILLDSWVLLLESLKISSEVVPNLIYKREVIRVKNEVELWLPISKSLWLNMEYEDWLYLNKLFNEEFAYVVNTWEETWTLSESLKKIWSNYDKELKRTIANLSASLEPVIIVLVWGLVWVIVVWIMQPFFELWKVAKNL